MHLLKMSDKGFNCTENDSGFRKLNTNHFHEIHGREVVWVLHVIEILGSIRVSYCN